MNTVRFRGAGIALVVVCVLAALPVADAQPAGDAAIVKPVRQIDFSPDGRMLAAGFGGVTGSGRLMVWDLETWRPVLSHAETVGVASVSFSPSGDRLAMAQFGPAAKVLSPVTGEVVAEMYGHAHYVRSIVFVTDTVIATCSYDRSVRLWDAATGTQLAELGSHERGGGRSIAASPDGKWLITGATSPDARLWNVEARNEAAAFRVGDLVAPAVGFSRDGNFFLTGRNDGIIRIRETETHEVRAAINANNTGFDLSADNRTLLVYSTQPTIRLYRLALAPPSGTLREQIDALIAIWDDDDYGKREDASRQLLELGLLAEPQLRAAMESDSPEVRIRARRAREAILSPEPETVDVGHRANVGAVRISPDGRLVASGDADGVIKIWTLADKQVLFELKESGP